MFLHYLKTHPPTHPHHFCFRLWHRLPNSSSQTAPSCLSKFTFAWIINLSQEWRRRRQGFLFFFFSFFVSSASVRLGLLGLFCFTMRASSLGFDCLLPAVVAILSFPPLNAGNACGARNRKVSLFSTPPIKENAVVSFFWAKEKKEKRDQLGSPSCCLSMMLSSSLNLSQYIRIHQ